MEKGKLYKIVFLDHCEFDDKPPTKERPVLCTAYGRLVKETDEYITLLMAHELNPPDSNPHNVGFIIVKGAIKKIVPLKEEEVLDPPSRLRHQATRTPTKQSPEGRG